MEQYIPKAAVMAEIETLINSLRKSCNPNPFGSIQECLADAQIEALSIVKESIEDINAKEVDLNKEIDDWYNIIGIPVITDAFRHFYELGLKARKGE